MRIFKNKFLVKLIATLCLFLTLLNFIGTSKVYAATGDEIWGGVLIKPIVNLLTGIGDAIMEILHKSVQEQGAAIIKIDGNTSFWEGLVTVFAIIVGILAAVAFIAVLGGIAAGVGALIAHLGRYYSSRDSYYRNIRNIGGFRSCWDFSRQGL